VCEGKGKGSIFQMRPGTGGSLSCRRTLAWMVLMLLASVPMRASAPNHIGLNQKVLVVCLKFSDVSQTRLTAAQWVNLLNTQVNNYFQRATHGKTTFVFERPTGQGVPSDGWLSLNIMQKDWPGTTDGARLAAALADPFVDFHNYNRILVILNAVDRNMDGTPM